MRTLPKAAAARLTLAVAVLLLAGGASADGKPRVPIGRDPGGIAVAVVETGVDYTLPAIAQRLARDGEGELVGWDVVDNDRQPFKVADDLEEMSYTHRGTAMARMVLNRARSAKLIPVRIATDDAASVRAGLAYSSLTPARVAVLALKGSSAALWAAVRDAVSNSKTNYLLIVAANDDQSDPDRIKERFAPALTGIDNVIIVTACDRTGGPLTTADGTEADAEVAVNAEAFTGELIGQESFGWKPEASIAAAEVAALAVRLAELDPNLKPAELKTIIMGLAKPFNPNQEPVAKSGWIAEPWRHFLPGQRMP